MTRRVKFLLKVIASAVLISIIDGALGISFSSVSGLARMGHSLIYMLAGIFIWRAYQKMLSEENNDKLFLNDDKKGEKTW